MDDSFLSGIKHVVFSGGGLKGFAFIGALRELMRDSPDRWKSFSSKIKAVSGTSIGCMGAFICSVGFPLEEIQQWLLSYDFSRLINLPSIDVLAQRVMGWSSWVPSVPRNSDYYLSDGKGLYMFYRDIISFCVGNPDITMKELWEKTGKETHFYTCVLETRKCIDISRSTYPHLPVWTAMAASSALPFIFPPVLIDKHECVDGGIMLNTPVCLYPIDETIIFKLKIPRIKEQSGIDRWFQLWECLFAGQTALMLNRYPEIYKQLILIPCRSSSLMDLIQSRIPKEMILDNIEEGRRGVRTFAFRSILLLVIALRIHIVKRKRTTM